MTLAKNNISYKNKSVRESRIPSLGQKNLMFAHETIGGENFIDFTSINTPTPWTDAGFINPTASEIGEANLYTFRENLFVSSTLRPHILPTEYRVTNVGITFLNFVAQPEEIFVFQVSDISTVGTILADSRPIFHKDTLILGNTTFFVGDTWVVGKYPQAVMVFENGVLLNRNTDNSSVTLDGDYYEVPSGGSGLSNTIEFNVSSGSNRIITVASTIAYVEKPQLSQIQSLEALAGQVDRMIPDLATLASEPQSKYQSAPNNIDLLNFNNDVYKVISATGLVVGPGFGSDFSSVQDAINAASDGDKITVLQGTYTENLVIGKKVYIEGLGHNTLIDGTVSLNAGSNRSMIKFLKFNDDITGAVGVKELIITDCWLAVSKAITVDNLAENLVTIMQES